MKLPWSAGTKLPPHDWQLVRSRLMFDCCKWDIQSDDHCVAADFPLILKQDEWDSISSQAEALSREALAAERELLFRPDLQKTLGVSEGLTGIFQECAGGQLAAGRARIMRFDFHFTSEGWRISEVNADVPGGFIEASGFTEIIAEFHPGYLLPPDVAVLYADAIAHATPDGSSIALVHATAHCDDRQVMEFLAQRLQRNGLNAIPLSPTHLKWESGVARINSAFATGQPGFLVRFFPAEWLPSLPTGLWEPWFCGGTTPMSNPGSAILIQSKRLPLVWDKLKVALPTWRSLLSETRDPRHVPLDSPEWVFKLTFGRVGEDVGIHGVTEQQEFREIVEDVRRHPDSWIAQRRFEAIPLETDAGVRYPCVGVFTLDGRTAGAYGRISTKPLIDQSAQDIAVLIGEVRR